VSFYLLVFVMSFSLRLIRNQNIHYRFQIKSLLEDIATISFKIYFNIIFSSMPVSVKWSNSNKQIPSNIPTYIKIYYKNALIKDYMFQP
jgi:hypothetical protein